MKLLSFSVSNHRSIRDTQTLEFYSNWPHSASPAGGWASVTVPVSLLLGPNASGKSNLLDAVNFAMTAIRLSATSWRDSGPANRQPHFPYLLDGNSRTKPSAFELEFAIDQTRYVYGFEWSYEGVQSEWLERVPNRRWAKCFERHKGQKTYWNKSFMSPADVRELGKITETELLLSVGLRNDHPILAPIARELIYNTLYIPVGTRSQQSRVDQLTTLIREGKLNIEDLSQLMLAADTGIQSVKLDQQRIPEEFMKQVRRLVEVLNDETSDTPGNAAEGSAEAAKFSDEELSSLVHTFRFFHRGVKGPQELGFADQSTGTLSWLATAPAILEILRDGGVLIADELDSSLHQSLMELIINAFSDPSINVKGAQLIFTSHNTNILEHARDLNLTESSFWFVEKNTNGSSEVYPLTDFELHQNANYERRYLSGRYGAIPLVSLSTFRTLVGNKAKEN